MLVSEKNSCFFFKFPKLIFCFPKRDPHAIQSKTKSENILEMAEITKPNQSSKAGTEQFNKTSLHLLNML